MQLTIRGLPNNGRWPKFRGKWWRLSTDSLESSFSHGLSSLPFAQRRLVRTTFLLSLRGFKRKEQRLQSWVW